MLKLPLWLWRSKKWVRHCVVRIGPVIFLCTWMYFLCRCWQRKWGERARKEEREMQWGWGGVSSILQLTVCQCECPLYFRMVVCRTSQSMEHKAGKFRRFSQQCDSDGNYPPKLHDLLMRHRDHLIEIFMHNPSHCLCSANRVANTLSSLL